MKSTQDQLSEQKVSLLALIFFLMGALPLYSYFQALAQPSGSALTALNSHPLVRVTILGLAVAGAFELVTYLG
jgi:uncharacterized membrane protein